MPILHRSDLASVFHRVFHLNYQLRFNINFALLQAEIRGHVLRTGRRSKGPRIAEGRYDSGDDTGQFDFRRDEESEHRIGGRLEARPAEEASV